MLIFCFQTQNTVNPKSVYLLSRKEKQKQTEKKNGRVLDN